jgi:hypothetical protein
LDAISLDALLLRTQAPDLVLRPGMHLVGRVLERHGAMGLLLLAGVPLSARLPDDVEPGRRLRLTVREIHHERVVLAVDPEPPATPPAPIVVPLLDGRSARLEVSEREPGGRGPDRESESASVTLAWESPALGRLDLVVEVAAGGVRTTVAAAPGEALERCEDEADALRQALAAATGREAVVRIVPRRDPFEAYA